MDEWDFALCFQLGYHRKFTVNMYIFLNEYMVSYSKVNDYPFGFPSTVLGAFQLPYIPHLYLFGVVRIWNTTYFQSV